MASSFKMVRVRDLLLVAASRVAAVRAAAVDCRTEPTWIGKEAACASHTGWSPRSDLWKDQLDRFERIVMSDCVAEESRRNLARSREHRSRTLRSRPHSSHEAQAGEEAAAELPGALEQPKITNIYPDPGTPLVVEVAFAFSEYEAAALRATAACVREYHSDTHFQARSFVVGGNNCTFMPGYLQVLAPGVAARVVEVARAVWSAAHWERYGYRNPATMGLRTIEHLRYGGGGRLGSHLDSESEITVLVALSDPNDYDGGEYVLYTPDETRELERIKLDRHSALVFRSSEVMHGVSPISGGVREMLAVELWNEDDVPFNALRPTIRSFHEEFLRDADDSTDQEDL